jgi:hypothetical protein
MHSSRRTAKTPAATSASCLGRIDDRNLLYVGSPGYLLIYWYFRTRESFLIVRLDRSCVTSSRLAQEIIIRTIRTNYADPFQLPNMLLSLRMCLILATGIATPRKHGL